MFRWSCSRRGGRVGLGVGELLLAVHERRGRQSDRNHPEELLASLGITSSHHLSFKYIKPPVYFDDCPTSYRGQTGRRGRNVHMLDSGRIVPKIPEK